MASMSVPVAASTPSRGRRVVRRLPFLKWRLPHAGVEKSFGFLAVEQSCFIQIPLHRFGPELTDAGNQQAAAQLSARHERPDFRIRLRGQNCVDVVDQDPSGTDGFAVVRLAHVRLRAVNLGRFYDCLLEGQVLECMERVVVNKDANRALGGQQMRRVGNDVPKGLGSTGAVSTVGFHASFLAWILRLPGTIPFAWGSAGGSLGTP